MFLSSRQGPLRPCLDHCPPSAMDLWSMGLAVYRRADTPRYNLEVFQSDI
jgi:hypothetical protein